MQIILSSHILIRNKYIDSKLFDFVKKNLTFNNPKYTNAIEFSRNKTKAKFIPRFIKAFSTSKNFLYISRGFLSPLLMYLNKNNISYKIIDNTVTNNFDFELSRMKLRKYQKLAAIKAKQKSIGIVKMPCGAGKTITMTDVIRKLKQNTLIIVHTNFIMNQWINYFKQNYDYELGIIQGDNVNIKPITVAMIQTLNVREINEQFVNFWGCIITDEVHHVPADTFFDIVNKFPAKYRFGTTATARRTDGLTNMVFATMGEIIYSIKSHTLSKQKYLTIPTVKLINTNFINKSHSYNGIIKEISINKKRNIMIASNIYNNMNSFNLVLSNRIEHLKNLVSEYSKFSDKYVLITSDTKPKERLQAIQNMSDGTLHVIFATQLADEGLDIPNLDIIHLAYPTKSDGVIEQRIGRVQRYKKHTPIVFDYVDNLVPNLYSFTQNRLNLYKNLELTIEQES